MPELLLSLLVSSLLLLRHSDRDHKFYVSDDALISHFTEEWHVQRTGGETMTEWGSLVNAIVK